MKYLYGIDIGGTTVKMGLFGEDGTLKEKWEIKTRTEENGKNILPDIAQAVNDHSKANSFDKEDVIGLGVGVPGAVLEFSKVNECVNLGWGSVDVAGELSKLTGCKVKATNDANAAALGEIWMGAPSCLAVFSLIPVVAAVMSKILITDDPWEPSYELLRPHILSAAIRPCLLAGPASEIRASSPVTKFFT